MKYESIEHHAQRYCFQPVGSIHAGTGSADSLIRPHEYHSIRNPGDNAVTVSQSAYSGPMLRCAVFQRLLDYGSYVRTVRQLGLDRTH